jgi:REP element-mobilizing transposase RayT
MCSFASAPVVDLAKDPENQSEHGYATGRETEEMTKRKHLKRLPAEYYRGEAIVHWTLTIRDRKCGWLTPLFLYRFRELLTHSCFRYGFACPVFCLMPDHMHVLWMGLMSECDQLRGMKHFRKTLGDSLARVGFGLQDQSYDHVLRSGARSDADVRQVCEYIACNPVRSEAVQTSDYQSYPFTGCVIPGYPDIRFFDTTFWDQLDRTLSFLRESGVVQFSS